MDWLPAATAWGLLPLAVVLGVRRAPQAAVEAPAWLGRVAVAVALAALGLSALPHLTLPPLTFDDWWYAGLGAKLADGDLGVWRSAFTEHVHPSEPTVRPLIYIVLGVIAKTCGSAWLGWHLVSLALHLGAGALVFRLGLRLFDHRPAALLGAALWLAHPIHVETIGWLSALEGPLLALSYLGAVCAHLERRWLVSGVLCALALATKEAAVTLPGALVLVDLARPDVRLRDLPWRAYAISAGLVLAALGWRLALAEPDNARMAAYLADLTTAGVPGLVHALVVVAPRIVLAPLTTSVASFAPVFLVVLALTLSVSAAVATRVEGARTPRRWLAFAALWALGLLALSAWDLEVAEAPGIVGLVPSWKLRHATLALVGPALVAARLACAIPSRVAIAVVGLGLVAGAGTLLVVAAEVPAVAGQRVVAAAGALEALSEVPNAGVRVVEPEDPIASLVLYRRLLEAQRASAPLLIGEPRCACAREALAPPLPGATLRAFSEWMHAPQRTPPLNPPGLCLCEYRRTDLRWYGWDGTRFVPD